MAYLLFFPVLYLYSMKPDPEVINYIEQFPPELSEVMFRLRECIVEVVPDVEEAIKWRAATFSRGGKPVCYVAGFKKHVSLAFHNGLMLRDPNGLLSGSGKFLRFIRYRNLDDVDVEQVKFWILEAFYT